MNKRENGKVRFNIIDIIIVIIVIGCIAGVVVRYNIVDKLVLDTKRDEVKISFLVTGISPEIAGEIKDGDEFYVVGSTNTVGILDAHTVTNSRTVEDNEAGRPVESFDDTLRDVEGEFTSYGVMNDNGFFLGGTLFAAPGKTLVIESHNVRISVIITEIVPV